MSKAIRAKVVLIIALAFVVGLAFSSFTACSKAAGSNPRIEYKVIDYSDVRHDEVQVEALLNKYGREGWEVRALDWNNWRVILAR